MTYHQRLIASVLTIFPLAAAAQGGPPALRESSSLLNYATNAAGLQETALSPELIVAHLIQIALGFTGIVMIVLIIYGGWLWGTAEGNEEQVTKARKLITESIIGIIIVFGAYFIVAFVITRIGEAIFEPLFPF